jgi:hypothetical protein
MKLFSFARLILYVAVAYVALTACPSVTADSYQHPAYIAIRSDGEGGTGTATDPYNGSVAPGKLADLISGFSANTHIIFGPGVFAVDPFELKPGDVIEGSSAGTTLQLAPQSSGWGIGGGNSGSIIWGISAARTNNVVIKNILFDCNLQNQPSGSTVGAVLIYGGSNSRIENCRAINWGTGSSTIECFVFTIAAYNDGGGTHSGPKILNCHVDTPAPIVHGHGGTTAICIFDNGAIPADGGSFYGGEIAGCVVHDITIGSGTGQPFNFNAYTLSSMGGGVCRNNQAYNLIVGSGSGGIAAGWYHDTGSIGNQLITGNYFSNVGQGIFDSATGVGGGGGGGTITNLQIKNNYISATSRDIALYNNSNVTSSGFTIQDNTLAQSASGVVGVYLGTLVHNAIIAQNTIDADHSAVAAANYPWSNGNLLSGNRRTDGAAIFGTCDGFNYPWQQEPNADEQMTFTPSTTGWYRIAWTAPGAGPQSGGKVMIRYATPSFVSEVEFSYSTGGYGQGSSVTQLRGYQRGGGFAIDQVRTSDNNADAAYVDVHLNSVASGVPITVYSYGSRDARMMLVPSPVVGATSGASSVATLSFQNGGPGAGTTTFANLPSNPGEGATANITDSTTNAWGAAASGGGVNHVSVRYNGSNWTVTGK